MLDNLYTFKKTSRHVRIFKWLYGTDPTETFNTMCPYFWSWVFTVFFFPLILFVKLFGKAGNRLVSSMESYKRDRRDAQEKRFVEKCSVEILTDEEAYYLYNSKCWYKFSCGVDYEIRKVIQQQAWKYENSVTDKKEARVERRAAQIKEIKTSKYFPFVAYTVTTVVLSLIVYTFYSVFYSLFTTYTLDFKTLKAAGKVAGWVAFIVGAAYLIFNYIFLPFAEYLKCVKLPKCKLRFLLLPFIYIGKLFVIICDMIYMTYKKACPRITWEEKE